MKNVVWTLLLLLLGTAQAGTPQVPETMTYCGMTLNFTPAGRAAIQKHVDKLHANQVFHQVLVEKAKVYLPFVAHAFQVSNAPEDLKYICLQESALQGDAVSSSNAVGFWQFKSFTAEEVGLMINASVDERKHIYRSSLGAAKYFSKNYKRHPNWVHAVISYYAGGTGAIPYINTDYYGATSMVVDENLHWYAQKAIAHKVAFEPSLSGAGEPAEWLEPVASQGETNIWSFAKNQGVTVEELRKFNLWITASPLPEGYQVSFYVPRKDKPYAFVPDPYHNGVVPELKATPGESQYYAELAKQRLEAQHKLETELALVEAQKPTPEKTEKAPEVVHAKAVVEKYRELPQPYSNTRTYYIAKEPMMGREFVLTTGNFKVSDISLQFGIAEEELRTLNSLGFYEEPPVGTLLWLVKPRKATVYIVQTEKSLTEVAARTGKHAEKLAILNHLDTNSQLQPGQKLYLRTHRPADEPIIVYTLKDDTIDLSEKK